MFFLPWAKGKVFISCADDMPGTSFRMSVLALPSASLREFSHHISRAIWGSRVLTDTRLGQYLVKPAKSFRLMSLCLWLLYWNKIPQAQAKFQSTHKTSTKSNSVQVNVSSIACAPFMLSSKAMSHPLDGANSCCPPAELYFFSISQQLQRTSVPV